ncbi:hypothetical protein SLS60_011457 [Paraconiothyrium brasiliense]|uniref:Uncharacterized protein n=1 Tax=Paraconiothyrium brasiliense TaxID=300254 RepID=A0ABR3QJY0_9PLEO
MRSAGNRAEARKITRPKMLKHIRCTRKLVKHSKANEFPPTNGEKKKYEKASENVQQRVQEVRLDLRSINKRSAFHRPEAPGDDPT